MASIKQRGKSFSVIYAFEGQQKWESFPTEGEALKRKTEIEYLQDKGTFVPPSSTKLQDFLAEYIDIYGTTKWGHSAFANNVSLINNYINPNIGSWKMKEITVKKMDMFFMSLKTQKAIQQKGRSEPGLISDRCIYDVNLLLSNAFDIAVAWEQIGKNPVTRTACPEREDKTREIWDPTTAKKALSVCKDLNLLVCMHLSIACSMRMGEISGLRWQNVSFGEVDNSFEGASLLIKEQLQRISKDSFEKLSRKKEHIGFVFPELKQSQSRTMLVLILFST